MIGSSGKSFTTHVPTSRPPRPPARRLTLLVVVAALVPCLALAGCAGPRDARREAQGDFPTANERLAEARTLATQAQRAADDDKPDLAIDLYRQAVSKSSDLPAAWNNLGVLLLEDENYLDAAQAFKVAADLSPTESRPLENLGLTYHRSGHSEKALSYYIWALERQPSSLPALRGAIVSAQRLGLRDEATLERVQRAVMLERDPKFRAFFEREQIKLDEFLSRRETRRPAATPTPPTSSSTRREP